MGGGSGFLRLACLPRPATRVLLSGCDAAFFLLRVSITEVARAAACGQHPPRKESARRAVELCCTGMSTGNDCTQS